jgi:hypothetical protein
MKTKYIISIAGILVLVLLATTYVTLTGNYIYQGNYSEVGFAPPYNVFENNTQIFNITPDDFTLGQEGTILDLIINVSIPGGIVYKTGYFWNNETVDWEEFNFSQETLGDSNWILDSASTNILIDKSKLRLNRTNFVVVSTCKKYNNEWECGCINQSEGGCGFWNLQLFKTDVVQSECVDEMCSSGDVCVEEVCSPKIIGLGTFENPLRVYDCQELQNMNQNLTANYALERDIDCSSTKEGDSIWGPKGFEPIGASTPFTGSLDGQDYSILNFYSTRGGLIGNGDGGTGENNPYIGATAAIYNLNMLNAEISTSGSAGILANRLRNGFNVTDVEVSGSVVSNDSGYAGGLVSSCASCHIMNSSAIVSVGTHDGGAGGLVGYMAGGSLYAGIPTIENSYAAGIVSGGTFGRGGLAGDIISGHITNSYSIAEVTDEIITPYYPSSGSGNPEFRNGVGGFVGNLHNVVSFSGIGNYYDSETSNQAKSVGNVRNGYEYKEAAESKTTEEMKQQLTFVGWDFVNIWDINPGINQGYPTLR